MAWHIVIMPEAKLDIQEGIYWYNSKQKGLGKRFHKEAKNSIRRLSKSPFRAIKYNDVRYVQLHQFPYLVHYIIEESTQTIIILGVLNTNLNPAELHFPLSLCCFSCFPFLSKRKRNRKQLN
jgi:hypothetical protein